MPTVLDFRSFEEQIEKDRRKLFEKKYKEAFKEEVHLKPLNKKESEVFSLNYYGIKSNWM